MTKPWQQVTLKGSESFRRNAWIEANLAGMKTRGFDPQEQDLALLEAARRERDALTIRAGKRGPEAPRPPSTSAPAPKQALDRATSTPAVDTPTVATAVEAVSPARQSAPSPVANGTSAATPAFHTAPVLPATATAPEALDAPVTLQTRPAPA